MNTKQVRFEQAKIQRLLKTNGEYFEFKRNRLDKFKQQINETEKETYNILGVYHETQGYVSMQINEASMTRAKKQPMVLTTFEEAKEINLSDILKYNGKRYKVINVRDVLENGVFADISMEVVDDGRII